MRGAASPPHAVPNGRCASPPRRLPSTPLLTGLPPRFFRHWRRSAPPPWPAFEKSGGKLAGKLLWGSGELCRPAAHRERRARFLYRKPGRKGMVDGSLGRRKFQRTGGGGGRARSALKERARGLWPRARSFVWQAEGRPWGRPSAAKRRRPPAGPRRFHQRQKGKAKARPYGQPSHAPSTAGKS